MHRKLIAACVSLVALAIFALPAIASATSPVLTEEPGVAVSTPKKITATNTGNTVMTTSLGNIECTKAVLTGTLTTNAKTVVNGDIETATFTGTESENRCSGPIGAVKVTAKKLPWCVRAAEKPADVLTLRSGSCTGAAGSMEFTLDSSLAGECTYTKTEVLGEITTGTGLPVHVTKQEFAKSAGGFLCPGSGSLDMTFDLYKDPAEHTTANHYWFS